MPFLNYGGPCAEDVRVKSQLIEGARLILQEEKGSYLEIRSTEPLPVELPTLQHKVSMTISLDSDAAKLWKGFSTNHRKTLRKAFKGRFTVRSGVAESLDDFYSVLLDSWRNLGTPLYGRGYFRDIATAFPHAIRVFNLYDGEVPVATACCGFHRNVVEGMWNGMRQSYRSKNPNYVLYWEMIKYACEAKYGIFHLGRSSTESGGEIFKRKWNASPHQLYWSYLLGSRTEIPGLRPENKKFYALRRMWRRLPSSVCGLIGPRIARGIP